MSSSDDEKRVRVLEADPDGIDWKVEQAAPAHGHEPLSWLDAMLSLFTELEGFRRMFGERVRAAIAGVVVPGLPINGQWATEKAMQEVLGELELVRRELVRAALDGLGEKHSVPRGQLVPQLVGQDWRESSLTDAGVLQMRGRFWMRKAPHVEYFVEAKRLVWIPNGATTVRVRPS